MRVGGYGCTTWVEGPALVCTLGKKGMQTYQGEISPKGEQREIRFQNPKALLSRSCVKSHKIRNRM